jgi:hypothetical protein
MKNNHKKEKNKLILKDFSVKAHKYSKNTLNQLKNTVLYDKIKKKLFKRLMKANSGEK